MATAAEPGRASALQRFLGARDASATPALCVIHLNLVCYALCYWMTQPVLPFLSRELGADAVLFGWLQTTFSFVQLVGGPVIGRVCDTRGARLALLLSQAGAAGSYLLLGAASTLQLLFLSRLPTLLMHSMHAAQACATDLSTASSRARALGRLSLSYGIGMVLGAPLGGVLSARIGYHGVAALAGVISLATMPVSRWVLPAGRLTEAAKARPVAALVWQPAPRAVLLFKVVLGVGLSMQHSVQSMLFRDKYALSAKSLGFVQAGGGVAGILSNTFLVAWLVEAMSEDSVISAATASLVLALLALAAAPSYQVVLALLLPIMVSTSTMYTVTASFLTKAVDETHTGTAIGLDHASRSFCGMVAPVMGGYLYREYGPEAVSVSAAVLAGTAFLVWWGVVRAQAGGRADKSKAA